MTVNKYTFYVEQEGGKFHKVTVDQRGITVGLFREGCLG